MVFLALEIPIPKHLHRQLPKNRRQDAYAPPKLPQLSDMFCHLSYHSSYILSQICVNPFFCVNLKICDHLCNLWLIFRHVGDHFTVHGVDTLAGDIAHQTVLDVKDRQPVGTRFVEGPHHLSHRRGITQTSLWLCHQL